MDDIILKVSGHSIPKKVAASIVKDLNEKGVSHVSAIGASAVNQAVKAIAFARGLMVAYEKEVVCFPTFDKVSIEDAEVVTLNFTVTI